SPPPQQQDEARRPRFSSPRRSQLWVGAPPWPLLDVADYFDNFYGLWPQLLRQRVLQRLGLRCKTGLVDTADDLDAKAGELVGRLAFQLQRKGRLLATHFCGRRLDPSTLGIRKALPGLVAHPEEVVVGFVLGHRHHRRHFVMLVREIDVDAV